MVPRHPAQGGPQQQRARQGREWKQMTDGDEPTAVSDRNEDEERVRQVVAA
jgi:hypothetical protein